MRSEVDNFVFTACTVDEAPDATDAAEDCVTGGSGANALACTADAVPDATDAAEDCVTGSSVADALACSVDADPDATDAAEDCVTGGSGADALACTADEALDATDAAEDCVTGASGADALACTVDAALDARGGLRSGMSGGRVLVMGIVNVTGDSYFDASRCLGTDGELDTGLLRSRIAQMLREGVDIIDLGACSTRPGAVLVSPEEEWRRLAPALRLIRDEFPELLCTAPCAETLTAPVPLATCAETLTAPVPRLSIDTCWASIVERAHEIIGHFIVNDIYAGRRDPEMLNMVAALGLPYIAMHSLEETSDFSDYGGCVTTAVKRYFDDFAERASKAGISDWIIDPGFGFGKTLEQNWQLLRGMDTLLALGRPLLVGISRKTMIWRPLGIRPEDSLAATQAAHMLALEHGASILRVHDVAPARQTIALYRLALLD